MTSGRPPARSSSRSSASRTRAPSGSSSSISLAPARSRSMAKRRIVTTTSGRLRAAGRRLGLWPTTTWSVRNTARRGTRPGRAANRTAGTIMRAAWTRSPRTVSSSSAARSARTSTARRSCSWTSRARRRSASAWPPTRGWTPCCGSRRSSPGPSGCGDDDDRRAGMKRALIIATLFVLVPASAQASFPGANGPIAYVSSRGGPPVPMVFDPGDAAPRAVGRAGQVAPAWSPDGAALAVAGAVLTSGRGPTIFEIVTMRPDGADATPITTDRGQDFDPAWSADGRRIAYSRMVHGNRDIWVIDASGGVPERLTRAPADDRLPSWSPDGSQIAFTRTRANDGDIYVMNADGSALHNITKRHGDDEDPDWAPDGTRIAFTRYGEGATADVWTMTATGAGPRPLVRHRANDTQAAWSPDGSRVAFTSNRAGHDDIWAVGATGGRAIDLTPDPATDDSPAWGVRSAVGDLGAVPGLRRSASRRSGPSL